MDRFLSCWRAAAAAFVLSGTAQAVTDAAGGARLVFVKRPMSSAETRHPSSEFSQKMPRKAFFRSECRPDQRPGI